jgi:hypothetical protein
LEGSNVVKNAATAGRDSCGFLASLLTRNNDWNWLFRVNRQFLVPSQMQGRDEEGHPASAWVIQQLREAFPFDSAPDLAA